MSDPESAGPHPSPSRRERASAADDSTGGAPSAAVSTPATGSNRKRENFNFVLMDTATPKSQQQEVEDQRRSTNFDRDSAAQSKANLRQSGRESRESRPRSVCDPQRGLVFRFEESDVWGDDMSASQHRSTDEPRPKGPSQRMSTGLQVTLAQPSTASVATSTPLATNYASDAHWSIQQPSAPHSPGALSWHGEAPTSSDKSSETGTGAIAPVRLSRKESYKAQRQNYRREKKKATSALLSTLEDPAVLILADWLKVRGSLKSWTKLWCVLKPGLLLLYKSPKAKSNHWVGTVLLSACQVIERPSKKDGFCFKLYNPLEQTIWAPRGPHNETIGAVVQPLPTAHLIFRAPSQAAGKCWLDGLELALRCSNNLLRSTTGDSKVVDTTANHETQWSPEDLERHFNEQVAKLLTVIKEQCSDLNLSDNASTIVNMGDISASDFCEDSTASEFNLNNAIVRWNHIMSKFSGDSDLENDLMDQISGDDLSSSGEMENVYNSLGSDEVTFHDATASQRYRKSDGAMFINKNSPQLGHKSDVLFHDVPLSQRVQKSNGAMFISKNSPEMMRNIEPVSHKNSPRKPDDLMFRDENSSGTGRDDEIEYRNKAILDADTQHHDDIVYRNKNIASLFDSENDDIEYRVKKSSIPEILKTPEGRRATPESEYVLDKKRDSLFGLDFFKKNSFGTGSLRTKIFKEKKPKATLEKNSQFASKNASKQKEKITRSFSDPHDNLFVILSPAETEKNTDKLVEIHHNFFEENLLKIVSAFPKRRSSTPSAFFKIAAKDNEASAKGHSLFPRNKKDSFNEISITTDDSSKRRKPNLHLSGRRSAEPRMLTAPHVRQNVTDHNNRVVRERIGVASDQSSRNVRDHTGTNTSASRDPTPERFSLIRYDRLPSTAIEQRLGRQTSERVSMQGMYFTGQIVKEKELEGAGSESDSEGPPAQQPGEPPGGEEGGVLAVLKNVYAHEPNDHVPQSGEVMEELGEENKSLLWFLIKQVRPGMDLSKVVLPTFILEPRSFLDKLSDSFYHSDILARACRQTDAYERMKAVLTWYLSGLYRKPRGLKKPYNPVLGETFRCSWVHPQSGTRTYYVSEQVSHHPPVSAFYVSNRKEGFAVEATIHAKSKFYGNSTSAILEGVARVALLPLAETYLCTSPYAHCKGLLLGTLTMELGGRVTIHCPSTDYTADIDFKLKPFIGGSDSINMVSGRIRHHKETVATIEGHWDGRIDLRDKKTQEESPLIDASELKTRRLKRQIVVPEKLLDFESQHLWRKVSEAIANEDQVAATEQKTVIEEMQRERARELGGREHQPRFFSKALYTDGHTIPQSHGAEATHPSYQYNYHNFTPWDDSVDVLEYEEDYIIKTLCRTAHDLLPTRAGLQVHQPETEHSASETDSTNSHHIPRAPTQSLQSVAAALLRIEAALREQRDTLVCVSAAVRRPEALPANRRLACPSNAVLALVVAILVQGMALYYYTH